MAEQQKSIFKQPEVPAEDPIKKKRVDPKKVEIFDEGKKGPKMSKLPETGFSTTEDIEYHKAKTFPQMFEGMNGKLYAKNPFNNGEFSYAEYPSKADYDFGTEIHTFVHVDHGLAMAEFEIESGHEFKISLPDGKTEIFLSNLVGELLEPIEAPGHWIRTVKEYLNTLYQKHGRENVKFTHEEKTFNKA